MKKAALVLMALSAVWFVLTGAGRFVTCVIVLAVYCVIDRLKEQTAQKQDKPVTKRSRTERFLGALLLCGLTFMFAPLELETAMMWRYPFQRAFLGIYNTPAAWFPDFKDDVQTGFRFSYLPSILQGTGHESIRFVTSPERAAEIETQFAAQALYKMELPEEAFGSFREIPEQYRAAFPAAADGWDGTGEYYVDYDFWYADDVPVPGAMVYYLDARGNWNHPGSSVVIISSKTGCVQFSQFGYTKLAYGKN